MKKGITKENLESMEKQEREWRPGGEPYALMFANAPFPFDLASFRPLWKGAIFKICADGGGNRLYDFLSPEDRKIYLPDYIEGDLDSLRDDVRHFYEKAGVKVLKNPSQDSTDPAKCLDRIILIEKELLAKREPPRKLAVIIPNSLDRRFDHIMDSINSLFQNPGRNIFLLGSQSAVWLLPKGDHVLYLNRKVLGPHCGLIPIGGQVVVHSKGLQWELDGSLPLSFGGLISTSNSLKADVIRIRTENPLLWTVDFNPQAGFQAEE